MIRDIITGALFRAFCDDPTGITPFSDIASSIIQSRKQPKKQFVSLKLDSLPSALIGECASFLDQSDYFQFGKSNRRIYLGCYSPCRLYDLHGSAFRKFPKERDISRFLQCKETEIPIKHFLSNLSHRPCKGLMHQLNVIDSV